VEIWKVKECCDLEDGADLHFLVCLEEKKYKLFRGLGEFHGGYFNLVFSYFVSLYGGFFIPTIA